MSGDAAEATVNMPLIFTGLERAYVVGALTTQIDVMLKKPKEFRARDVEILAQLVERGLGTVNTIDPTTIRHIRNKVAQAERMVATGKIGR